MCLAYIDLGSSMWPEHIGALIFLTQGKTIIMKLAAIRTAMIYS
jgi:hypothetical protein